MPTTLKGNLRNLDTKDKVEKTRLARKYDYRISASGGGTVRLKIEYYYPGQIGQDGDTIGPMWKTLVPRYKTDSGQTTSGSFTIPGDSDDSKKLRFIFSRGAGTQGVDYDFFMEKA